MAPISLPAVLLGKVLGGAVFGLMMATIVTVGSVLIFGLHPNILYLVLILIPSLLVFSSLGALLCVIVKEVYEAQTMLNLPRFVMIFLCGVVFPVSAMPVALQYLSHVMPLTYTVDGLEQSFSAASSNMVFIDVLVLVGFFIVFIFPAAKLLSKKFE